MKSGAIPLLYDCYIVVNGRGVALTTTAIYSDEFEKRVEPYLYSKNAKLW
jgi:hypothetical protein